MTSTPIWKQTITLNNHIAQQAIEQQTPLRVSSLEILGEGFDNIAYLVNKTFVFRFPRRQMGIECMRNEIALVTYIARYVSFALSYPQYIGEPSEIYPAPFAGYRLLPGTPLSDTQAELIADVNFASALASWLKELHTLPVLQEHYAQITGDQSWRLNVQGRLEITKNRILEYQHYLTQAGFTQEALFIALEKLSMLDFNNTRKQSYVHGDLYSRHILVNNNRRPTGLIDWGDVHIGHPGIDLSIGFMIFSDSALEVFINTYGHFNTETKQIALLRAFYHSVILLSYCYEKQEENLKKWTILALTQVMQKIVT